MKISAITPSSMLRFERARRLRISLWLLYPVKKLVAQNVLVDIVPGKSRGLAVHAWADSVVLNGWCKNDSDIPNGEDSRLGRQG